MVAILMPIHYSYIYPFFNDLHNFTRLGFRLWWISASRFGGFEAFRTERRRPRLRWKNHSGSCAASPGWTSGELCGRQMGFCCVEERQKVAGPVGDPA